MSLRESQAYLVAARVLNYVVRELRKWSQEDKQAILANMTHLNGRRTFTGAYPIKLYLFCVNSFDAWNAIVLNSVLSSEWRKTQAESRRHDLSSSLKFFNLVLLNTIEMSKIKRFKISMVIWSVFWLLLKRFLFISLGDNWVYVLSMSLPCNPLQNTTNFLSIDSMLPLGGWEKYEWTSWCEEGVSLWRLYPMYSHRSGQMSRRSESAKRFRKWQVLRWKAAAVVSKKVLGIQYLPGQNTYLTH